MQKIIYKLAAVTIAIALGSCSSDLEFDNTQIDNKNNKEIGFRSFIDKGNATRATITNGDNILGFTVTGWWDRTNAIGGISDAAADEYLFNAFDITRREAAIGTAWDYSPKRYWPADDIIGGGVSFFAYSPASSKNVSQGLYYYKGDKIEYTVPNPKKSDSDKVAQEDFLLARTDPMNASSGNVELNFYHALSRVKFFARTTNTNLTYVVGDVALVNVNMNGKIDMENIPTDASPFPYPSPVTPLTPPITYWTEHANLDSISLDLGESPINLLGVDPLETSKYHSLHGKSNALMVLPQTTDMGSIASNGDRSGFWIKVSYKAYLNNPNGTYFAGSKDAYEDVYFQVIDEARTTDTTVPFTFEIGRQYNFYLEFGSEAGEEITFKVEVSDWKDVAGVDL
ncbi:fimbrillin family protein [Parabacteroides sp. PF5-9]|uniref:fimbrillin family protein n=1 Tax=Parabacteroides sp. PF5-9 TaxID=1742404 RepID=UPI002475E344|nr:fimbrillin family protein [Parabacteroides sp. PF5-9]MDH6357861.1 hypothetical protein [Parabacteroides sp. PF5-9]